MDPRLQDVDWLAIAAPLTLALAAVVVLLVDAFAGRLHGPVARHSSRPRSPILAVVGAAVPSYLLWGDPRSTFCIAGGSRVRCRARSPSTVSPNQFWAITLFGTGIVALLGTAAVGEGRTPQGGWYFLLLSSATGALTLALARPPYAGGGAGWYHPGHRAGGPAPR